MPQSREKNDLGKRHSWVKDKYSSIAICQKCGALKISSSKYLFGDVFGDEAGDCPNNFYRTALAMDRVLTSKQSALPGESYDLAFYNPRNGRAGILPFGHSGTKTVNRLTLFLRRFPRMIHWVVPSGTQAHPVGDLAVNGESYAVRVGEEQ